jgi:probable phosphoglycerate mutase
MGGTAMIDHRFAAFSIVLLGAALSSPPALGQDRQPQPGIAATASPSVSYTPPARRRIYLMRHGDVSYFGADGKPVADPDAVTLNEKGKAQADAAGTYFKSLGLKGFDRVVSSNLPRTIETAERVLAAAGFAGKPQQIAELREIKGGGLRTIPTEELHKEFLAFAQGNVAPQTSFLKGETAGSMQSRVYAAMDMLLADRSWDTALVVLHGIVNNAIVSRALTGSQDYFGRFVAEAGCLHVLDAGPDWQSWVVRAFNVCPTPDAYQGSRLSVLEKLLASTLKARAAAK